MLPDPVRPRRAASLAALLAVAGFPGKLRSDDASDPAHAQIRAALVAARSGIVDAAGALARAEPAASAALLDGVLSGLDVLAPRGIGLRRDIRRIARHVASARDMAASTGADATPAVLALQQAA